MTEKTAQQELDQKLWDEGRIDCRAPLMAELIDRGANVNLFSPGNGATLLMYVICRRNKTGAAQLLIHRGADIHARAKDGSTCMIYAAQSGHENIIRLLLEKGAPPHLRDDKGHAAADYAGQRGDDGVVRLLRQAEEDYWQRRARTAGATKLLPRLQIDPAKTRRPGP